MSTLSRLVTGSIAALAMIMLGEGAARATALAYDGFAYPVGPLPGMAGGTGFSGPWAGDIGVMVQGSISLTNALALPSTGALIGGTFNVDRPLTTPLTQSVFWASFMIEAASGNDQVWMGFDPNVTQFPFIAFGRRLGNYFIQNGSATASTVCCASGPGVTDLLIVKVTNGGAGSSVDLWVNKNPLTAAPDLIASIPAPPPLGYVNLQVQNGFLADEVRIGTVAQDVSAAVSTPAPLPGWTLAATAALLALIGSVAGRRRRHVRTAVTSSGVSQPRSIYTWSMIRRSTHVATLRRLLGENQLVALLGPR